MLKGCVIGLGRMGITHYAILNTHPDVEFVSVCDTSKFVLKNFRLNSEVQVETDWRRTLDASGVEFAIVATPTPSHAEIVTAALERGLHVFVEKPFVLRPEDGPGLVELARDRDLVNQVGYFLRFNSVFRLVKDWVGRGLIGRVTHYKNEMFGRTVLQPPRGGWRSKKGSGGGCMLDFASHCIDLSVFLFGPVRDVPGCYLRSVYSKHVEDVMGAMVEHPSGVIGNLLVNWSDEAYRRPYNKVEVFGDNGKIVADRQECRLYLRSVPEGEPFVEGWNVQYVPEIESSFRFSIRGAEFTNQLDHFVSEIATGQRQGVSSFADAIQTDDIIARISADSESRSRKECTA